MGTYTCSVDTGSIRGDCLFRKSVNNSKSVLILPIHVGGKFRCSDSTVTSSAYMYGSIPHTLYTVSTCFGRPPTKSDWQHHARTKSTKTRTLLADGDTLRVMLGCESTGLAEKFKRPLDLTPCCVVVCTGPACLTPLVKDTLSSSFDPRLGVGHRSNHWTARYLGPHKVRKGKRDCTQGTGGAQDLDAPGAFERQWCTRSARNWTQTWEIIYNSRMQ